MRSLISLRDPRLHAAVLLAEALIIGSSASVAAKRPPKPTPTPTPTATPTPTPPAPSTQLTVEIAATGTLEPSGEYANVDVTVTCPVGWTWSYGRLYVLRGDLGGAGTFSATCTGTAQTAKARVVNGNRFQLGDWTATAYEGITKNGPLAMVLSARIPQAGHGPLAARG